MLAVLAAAASLIAAQPFQIIIQADVGARTIEVPSRERFPDRATCEAKLKAEIAQFAAAGISGRAACIAAAGIKA